MNKKNWKNQYKIEKDFEKSLYKCKSYFNKLAKLAHGDLQRFSSLMERFQQSEAWERFVQHQVNKMLTPLNVQNERTWRIAAKKATRSEFIYSLLKRELKGNINYRLEQLRQENANLIKTLPSDVAQKVVNNVQEMAMEGKRASEIEQYIRQYTDQHTRASARLIARTEVSKAQSNLTQARAEALEVKWYVWRTEEDQRVRDSHANMNDVLVSWMSPPQPEVLIGEKSVGAYHAGCIWNCRCYAEPLVEIDDISWPHKVYYSGTIQTMTKAKFEEIM